MNIKSLLGKKVGILGYGREGQSVARYLKRHGVVPVLFDKSAQTGTEAFPSHFDEDYLSHLSEVEVLFRSPGFWRLDPALLEFEKSGGVITSQTIFFFENSPCSIVGVTGTKGKGTTTTLAYQMAKNSGKDSYLTGNIGVGNEPLDFLDSLTTRSLVFYELSSFQLQDLTRSPHVGVVLMVTADHLDQHGSLQEYHVAKQAITEFQKPVDFAIINRDFPASIKIGGRGEGHKLWIGNAKVDFDVTGILIDGPRLLSEGLLDYGVPDGLLLESGELTLKGLHNLQNVGAALLAGAALGLPLPTMIETAKSFAGLEHRIEFVAENNGVKFYNDSYSTTPETAIAAITAFEEPLFLILGGSEKFLDYSELAKKIAARKNLTKVFLIGQTANRLHTALREANANMENIVTSLSTLEKIFERLHSVAQPGSVVLLSPATASFDMFKDYKQRGEIFKKLVENW